MLKMSKCRSFLLVSILVLWVVSGCVTEKEEGLVWEQPSLQRLVSRELLERAKLKLEWENKLPITRKERLEQLSIIGDGIYALSDRNYLVSLNRRTGNLIFSGSLASPALTVLGLDVYKDELFTLIGNRLVEINAEIGTELRSKGLHFGVTCPAARNDSYFYLAGADGRLRTLRAKDKVNLFEVAADGLITSIVADNHIVAFATDRGNVTGMIPHKPEGLWEFRASDGVVGPIVRDGESLFVASRDTYVYKLDVRDGTTPVWKHQTGALLDRSPRVTQEVVYQYARYKGLSAIDKESGRLIWQLPEGVDLLAEANGNAYVITNERTLVLMDNKKAKQLYSVNLAKVSKYAPNTADSSIYIADEAGRVVCLRPVD